MIAYSGSVGGLWPEREYGGGGGNDGVLFGRVRASNERG